ncbi:hypothetical protein CDQ83_11445 [Clostridium thermosuccinogenes]|nr:hypothetical protein CDQ83_11445 [Pseudoclostridium thermosuccinogenes]
MTPYRAASIAKDKGFAGSVIQHRENERFTKFTCKSRPFIKSINFQRDKIYIHIIKLNSSIYCRGVNQNAMS